MMSSPYGRMHKPVPSDLALLILVRRVARADDVVKKMSARETSRRWTHSCDGMEK